MLRPVYSLRTAGQAPTVPMAPMPSVSRPVAAPARPFVPAGEIDDSATRTIVAVLFGALLVLRYCLTDPLWNQFVNYTDEGGSLIEKIHPATYGIILLLAFSLLRFRIVLTAGEVRIVRQFLILIGVIIGLSGLLQAIGRSVSMGYLLETYIGACLTGFMMLTLKPAHRQNIGHLLIIYLAVNATLSIIEKGLGQRLLPYPYEEISFRPTALTAHPLAMGLMHAGAVVFILATRWSGVVKGGLVFLVVLGTFAAGARTGAIISGLAALAGMMLTPMPATTGEGRLRLKAAIILALLIGAPALIVAADSFGFLERFYGGYFDENARARVDVYQVFDWVSTNEILFGTDLMMVTKMIFDRLGLLNESSVVVFVFQFGLFGALLLAATILWTLVRAAWGREPRAFIGIGAFVATASSNNAFSGKHALITMMILLCLAFRRETVDGYGRTRTLRWGEQT